MRCQRVLKKAPKRGFLKRCQRVLKKAKKRIPGAMPACFEKRPKKRIPETMPACFEKKLYLVIYIYNIIDIFYNYSKYVGQHLPRGAN